MVYALIVGFLLGILWTPFRKGRTKSGKLDSKRQDIRNAPSDHNSLKPQKYVEEINTTNSRYNNNVRPCFQRKKPDGDFILTVTTPWDEYHLCPENNSAGNKVRATKKISELLQIATDYDLYFSMSEGVLCISHSLYWNNFETGSCILSDFVAEVGFESTQYNDQIAPFRFSIRSEVKLEYSDETGEDIQELPIADWRDTGEVKSISQIRSAANLYHKTVLTALELPNFNAPFRELADLPGIKGIPLNQVYSVSYEDYEGNLVNDRICHLRRSIYSMPESEPIEWIFAYSESHKFFLDFKLSQLLSMTPHPPELQIANS